MKDSNNADVTVLTVGDSSADAILRKCLAIGADKAIRIDCEAIDASSVSKEIVEHCNEVKYDLVICGRESIDYNGGLVSGLIAGYLDYNFVTNCVSLNIENGKAKCSREISGGIEVTESDLPLVIGAQKGFVEESDLIIPNMRGIMMSRKKPLTVIQAKFQTHQTQTVKYQKLPPKSEVKLVKPEKINDLIDLLHNEAKVI